MVEKEAKLGFIFEEMYGENPSSLTLSEIDSLVFKGKKPKVVSIDTNVVSHRGNIFEVKNYDIDNEVDKELRKIKNW